VLILSNADGFRIDLDKLRERVLEPARDGDGAAHREVEIRKLLACDVRCRVHAGARLTNSDGEDVLDSLVAQKAAHKGVRFARCRPIPDGDGAHIVPSQQSFELGCRFGIASL